MLALAHAVYEKSGDVGQVSVALGRAREMGVARERALEVVYRVLEVGTAEDQVAVFKFLRTRGGFGFLTGLRKGLAFDGGKVVGSGQSLVARIVGGGRSGEERVRVEAVRCAGEVGAMIDSRSGEARGLRAMLDEGAGGWKERRERAEARLRLQDA